MTAPPPPRTTHYTEAAQRLTDARRIPALVEAAENVLLAHDMGCDPAAAVYVLREVLRDV